MHMKRYTVCALCIAVASSDSASARQCESFGQPTMLGTVSRYVPQTLRIETSSTRRDVRLDHCVSGEDSGGCHGGVSSLWHVNEITIPPQGGQVYLAHYLQYSIPNSEHCAGGCWRSDGTVAGGHAASELVVTPGTTSFTSFLERRPRWLAGQGVVCRQSWRVDTIIHIVVNPGIEPAVIEISYMDLSHELACEANFNGVDGLTVQDIFDFLSAYFANNIAADFNRQSGLSVQDIFDFLAAYFAGC